MSFQWIHDNPPHWDERKAAIVGGAPAGTFDLGDYALDDLIPGEWWRVEEGDAVLGYGWMDCTWGDAEMLLAVDPNQRKRGVGTFILDRLEEEAASRGVNYLYNRVGTEHPDKAGITRWLEARRFEVSLDGRHMRRVHPHER
jgi:GNAT superfamily N-acetyltransferase